MKNLVGKTITFKIYMKIRMYKGKQWVINYVRLTGDLIIWTASKGSSLYMVRFWELVVGGVQLEDDGGSHRMDWRCAETGINKAGNRMTAYSQQRDDNCCSGRMMEEEIQKLLQKITDIGERNDTKNLKMVVWAAEKGS